MVFGHRVSEGSLSMNPYYFSLPEASMSLWMPHEQKREEGSGGDCPQSNETGKPGVNKGSQAFLPVPCTITHLPSSDKIPHLLNGWQRLPLGTLIWRPPSQWAPALTKVSRHIWAQLTPHWTTALMLWVHQDVWLSAAHNGLQRWEGSQGEVERYVRSKVWH